MQIKYVNTMVLAVISIFDATKALPTPQTTPPGFPPAGYGGENTGLGAIGLTSSITEEQPAEDSTTETTTDVIEETTPVTDLSADAGKPSTEPLTLDEEQTGLKSVDNAVSKTKVKKFRCLARGTKKDFGGIKGNNAALEDQPNQNIKSPTVESPAVEDPIQGNPTQENPIQLNPLNSDVSNENDMEDVSDDLEDTVDKLGNDDMTGDKYGGDRYGVDAYGGDVDSGDLFDEENNEKETSKQDSDNVFGNEEDEMGIVDNENEDGYSSGEENLNLNAGGHINFGKMVDACMEICPSFDFEKFVDFMMKNVKDRKTTCDQVKKGLRGAGLKKMSEDQYEGIMRAFSGDMKEQDIMDVMGVIFGALSDSGLDSETASSGLAAMNSELLDQY